ncbi:D-alanyl-D-alanine carboxypeptidase/D-alanyl-D-alanine endopeptidase [Pleurocapsa sp. FMAR1]|uniref:D-alanyl-D-alanine carboxypeptidase/D-alanyl-D-alanine endopeptidase n=1 Tax=Pleurocapsa sp. FMAR1 TaxID=3040204 RepID=UPI0029C64FA2|nr:D-alanyl-D-alanine carboxypeptidase/D-alanyl-D-alanine-endopeptidase [Pleurocapsa sp. FMAR1]
MKLVFEWLRFFSLLFLLFGSSTINQETLAQDKDFKSSVENNIADDAPRLCHQDLSTAIENVINRSEFRRSRWGIEVQTLDGESLYSLNGDKFFTPASSAKLLTTAAVLSALGADYRFRTPIYAVGHPPNLTSLRLKGQGDPTISSQSLKHIVHQLQVLKIKRIEKLIIDDSYFEPPIINPTWEWLDVHSYFATAVNSTILNQNTVTLILLPQQIGQPVKFYWSDAIAARQWQVINEAITGALNIPYEIEIDGDLGKPTLQIRGKLAVNEPADVWDLAIVDPDNYFLESLRLYLAQSDIKVTQGIVIDKPNRNKLETELMAIASPPMQQIIAKTNQESNNLFAEVLARVLAKELNVKTPIEAINKSLNNLGINSEDYVLLDASGLSRQNLVTPKALVTVLRLMSRSKDNQTFRRSLAIAGVNGTLKNRFIDTAIKNNLIGKTGTLTGVDTLSGYLTTSEGKTIVFSILLNNSEQSSQKIRQAIDRVTVILDRASKC